MKKLTLFLLTLTCFAQELEIPAPQLLQIAAYPDALELRWRVVKPGLDIHAFKIERRARLKNVDPRGNRSFTINPFKCQRAFTVATGIETYIWRDHTALPGLIYSYRVCILGEAEDSDWSNPVECNRPAAAPIDGVTSPKVGQPGNWPPPFPQ